MWQSVSTEAAGWREALSDRANLRVIGVRVALAALSSLAGAVAAGYAGLAAACLAVTGASLVGSLAVLRARGRP